MLLCCEFSRVAPRHQGLLSVSEPPPRPPAPFPPLQDPSDPTKINIKLVVEEVQPKSVEVRGTHGDALRWR